MKIINKRVSLKKAKKLIMYKEFPARIKCLSRDNALFLSIPVEDKNGIFNIRYEYKTKYKELSAIEGLKQGNLIDHYYELTNLELIKRAYTGEI